MGTVVFTGVDAPLVSSLRKQSTLAGARFIEVADAELALRRLSDSGAEIDAMVIGPEVAEAMTLAQRVHAKDRDVAVLLLAAQGRSAELTAALRYAPYLGPEVSCCERAPDEVVERALSLAVQRTRQRRDYRAAMMPWRRKFAPVPGRPLRPEAVLERLLVQLPMGVLVLDQNGIAISSNRRALEFLSRSEREVLGKRLVALVPARIAPALEGFLARSAGDEGLPAMTFELERKTGALVLELTVTPVVSSASENGTLVLLQDVTERVRTAREREELRAEIESSQRLASLGVLAAGVGHEINNPLTYVMGNVQYVLERLAAGESAGDPHAQELGELLRSALEGANRIRSIVRDLRIFSRVESQPSAAVDIAAVLDQALALVSNEVKHRARVVKEYQPAPPVRGDSARLVQVFLNLLTNAAQAIRDGQVHANAIRVTIERGPPGLVVVGIHDTGEGIPGEAMSRIFEPFFTTKPVGQGTGLGLAICQRIVAEHGGSISVDSQPGEGTTFRVSLPALREGDVEVGRSPSVAVQGEAAPPRTTILVIDDEPAVGRVIALVLGAEHSVTVTTSGVEAVSRIEQGERFEVILCDVMMPALGGADVHERVTRIDAAQAERIVFMSGGVFAFESRAYLDRLPNARLDKPFRSEELCSLVRELTGAARAPAGVEKFPRKRPPG